jgi:hypothetical protein
MLNVHVNSKRGSTGNCATTTAGDIFRGTQSGLKMVRLADLFDVKEVA